MRFFSEMGDKFNGVRVGADESVDGIRLRLGGLAAHLYPVLREVCLF